MTPPLLAWVAVAAAGGAVLRYLLDFIITEGLPGGAGSTFPWGTVTVNLLGSFALGVLVGLALTEHVPPEWRVLVGTGFLGAFTTFSTWMVQTVRLLEEGRVGAAAWNALGSLALGMAAAAAGMWMTL